MREIKFRAWDRQDKQFVNPNFAFVDLLGNHWFTERGHNPKVDNGRYELMQYTGLKDKNGKEIYEGDILKGTKYHEEHIEQVKWTHGFEGDSWPIAGYDFEFDEDFKFNDEPKMLNTEVIGNIYENPDLLA